MYKIVMIGTYFGAWPKWFPAFFLSCKKNESIDWLFFTDCEIPGEICPNIRFIPMTLEELNCMASEKLGFAIEKGRYSQIDMRPAYGVIFDVYLRGCDFWGHCDFDVVWGDMRSFVTESILSNYQIISSRKNTLAGHFTVWKNEPEISTLFRAVPEYHEVFSDSGYFNFDERVLEFLENALSSDQSSSAIRAYWPKKMVVGWPELEAEPKGWYWTNGKIFDKENQEHIYVHFLTWKASMRNIDFGLEDEPERFIITRRGIWSSQPPLVERFLEATQFDARLQPLRRRLERRRKLARSYVELAFLSHSLGESHKVWSHAVRGLWYDPRWLRNRGLLSIAVQARFGRAPIAFLRRLRGGKGGQS